MKPNESEPPIDPDNLTCPEIVMRLVEILGRKLTAYLGGVKNVREVSSWIRGVNINHDQEARFRLALSVANILIEKDPREIVQAWMIGLNPELGDRVPLRLLREEPVETIASDLLAAARVMSTQG